MEYYDTDSIKVIEPSENELSYIKNDVVVSYETMMKQYLNRLYGTMVSCIHFTDGKENKDMNKNYIVVHDTVGGVGIIFKDKIGGVFKENEDGTARLLIVDGYTLPTTDKYEDIVKQII